MKMRRKYTHTHTHKKDSLMMAGDAYNPFICTGREQVKQHSTYCSNTILSSTHVLQFFLKRLSEVRAGYW